jgi:hypothetical protein
MCVYALISTLFLCYYCMGFICVNKIKTSPVPNIVPNIVPATAPIPSGLSQIVLSPPSTLFSPSTVSLSHSLSSTMFPPKSCSEYLFTSSSTDGPSFMSVLLPPMVLHSCQFQMLNGLSVKVMFRKSKKCFSILFCLLIYSMAEGCGLQDTRGITSDLPILLEEY